MTNTIDTYPTRRGQSPEFLDRPDSVVWSNSDSPISREQLRSYGTDGFLELDSMLSPDEVSRCTDEMTRLANDPELSDDDRLIREGGEGEVRSIFEVHRISTVFAELLTSDSLVDLARQILGSEVYIHQSRVNYKPGFGGGPFYWHSDFETWHAEDGLPRPRAFSMSLTLTPNYVHNGGLMIIPGSHRVFVSCAGETPKNHFKQSLSSHDPQVGMPDRGSIAELAGANGIKLFTGGTGSATVFDSNCMHGSNGNITPFPRSNVFVVYNSAENAPVEPFAAPERRPSFIASRDYTPIR